MWAGAGPGLLGKEKKRDSGSGYPGLLAIWLMRDPWWLWAGSPSNVFVYTDVSSWGPRDLEPCRLPRGYRARVFRQPVPLPTSAQLTISNTHLSVLSLFSLETHFSANLQILSHSLYLIALPCQYTKLQPQGPGLPRLGVVSEPGWLSLARHLHWSHHVWPGVRSPEEKCHSGALNGGCRYRPGGLQWRSERIGHHGWMGFLRLRSQSPTFQHLEQCVLNFQKCWQFIKLCSFPSSELELG